MDKIYYTWKDKLKCIFKGHDWNEYTDGSVDYSIVTGRVCLRCGKEQKIKVTFKNK